ncbi:nuclear pore complex protein Nup98-Nup96 [Anopheles ziemanni]|uniref:nuclear pore complex protein Nup98-Nup96 n=1 Tax=Anopheles coustani TaxID=139045 RepID=UPI00265937AB|nr:nuclear pore complex protein Nup98-Nup96 [Anopheles coustani]XP_058129914.1 nuclear pore complex protein Nup98-Nup96 [Anopheles coustani]XP_058174824.1 nuclear pore complex protein Nup98-Nup96 [Anopheles ziemanni]
MFGAKPGGFGQPATNTGFGTFGTNTATASPFGQTTAFSKPATGAFGATPAFGQQPTTSLFGQTQPTGGLFGASTTTAPAFGAAATTQPGFGAFGQTQPQAPSLFGTQNNTAANTSLFGNNNNTSFGAPKPAGFGGFGQPATQTTSLFGQSSTNNTATTGFFGQNTQPAGGSSLFGAAKPAFGAAAPVVGGGNGTAVVKYQQTHGTDTLVKNGQTTTVNTKQHCITFMKDYENKSVEELRFEDYAANRKGPQAGGGGLFGGGVATTSLFGGTAGQQQPTGLFGQNQQQQTPAGGLFGTSTNTFGATTTPAFGTTAGSTFNKPFGSNPVATSAPGFGFAQSTTSTLGGGLGVNKPAFGATGTTTGLFGQSATPATSTFGQTPVFGGFGTQNAGAQQQQQGGLFSGAGTGTQGTGAFGTLGATGQQSSFSFGNNTQTSAAGSTLFGAKPTNTFGTLGGTTFGQGATSTAPTFGLGTNTSVAGGVGGTSFFGSTFNKPAAPTFGLGTNTSTGTLGGTAGGGLTFGTGSTSLFGNTNNKPGGLGTGTGLFGNTSTLGGTGGGAFGTMGGMGGTFGTGTSGGLGMGTLGGGMMGGGAMGTAGGQQPVPIHQQILAMATSPYGDNPIFKGIKPLVGPSEDSLKPTNPSFQKAVLEGSNYQLKVSSRSGGTDRVKVKPLGAAQLKKSIFEGLEEYDSTLEDSFTLKPNAKRLIIKPRSTKPTIVIPEKAPNQSQASVTTPTRSPTTGGSVLGESFQNQIPLHLTDSAGGGRQQQQGSIDSSRRVSWLQSNVLDKVRQQQQQQLQQDSNNPRLSESVLDNTLKDFAASANSRSDLASSPGSIIREESDEAEDNSKSGNGSKGTAGKDGTGNTSPTMGNQTVNDSFISNRSFLNETSMIGGGIGTDLSTSVAPLSEEAEPHPTGIVLRRAGYYTIPSLDEIAQLMDEDGRCVVPNFTIGRKGYGNVYFNEPIDVAGLNLDEIVHFRHKEVIIYPDDENKPPVGSGLNRKAQITLDQVWPHDKTLHEPIKDPQRLALLDYEAKLRRVCDKHDTRFLEYRPATGSWVFKVEHFSKYGLSDSEDEEGGEPVDPKKLKIMPMAGGGQLLQQKKVQLLKTPTQIPAASIGQAKDTGGEQVTPRTDREGNVDIGDGTGVGFNTFDEFFGDENMNFNSPGGGHRDTPTSPTAAIALEMGTDPHKIQLMKASFFADDEFDRRSMTSEFGGHSEGRDSPDQMVPTGGRPIGGLLLQSLYGSSKPLAPVARRPLAAAEPRGGLLKMDGSVVSIGGSGFTPGRLLKSSTVKSVHGGSTLSLTSVRTPLKQPPTISGTKTVALPPIPRPMGPQALPLVVKRVQEKRSSLNMVIPLSRLLPTSVLYGMQADLTCFHGRKFKIGWSHGTLMVQLNTRDNCTELVREREAVARKISPAVALSMDAVKPFFRGRANHDFSPAALQLLRIQSTAETVTMTDAEFARSIDGHLRIQFHYDERRAARESDCPQLVAGGKHSALEEHAEHARALYETTGDQYDELCANVWTLLVALWGVREELEDVDEASHQSTMFRRDLLSEWVERVVTEQSQREVQLAEKRDYLDQLLGLLMTHKVLEACELAFENGDISLSMLLAQISGGPIVRHLLQHQLSSWQHSQTDRFIDSRRLKVFMAIAGMPLLVSSTDRAINLFEDAEWLRVFALHLWYLSKPTASIPDTLFDYEDSFRSKDYFAQSPEPPYRVRYPAPKDRPVYDLRYHLLKLYSKRSHPLEPLLNPASHTSDPIDYRLSWLLLQELETLGYRHCSEYARARLHTAFAAQLESHGLWHWAIYVLLHLNDQPQRELAVQQLLYRHVQLLADGADDEQQLETEDQEDYYACERFIVDELGIPEKWIYWAKAVRAGSIFDYRRQAHYLLQAKQWSLAHETILLHLAPAMVMNDKTEQLMEMLHTIEDVKQIPSWSTKGQILVDFMELNQKFELLKDTTDRELMDQRLEALKPKLSDLCSVIKLFPCPTPSHTLLQSEIAKRLVYLIRTYYATDPRISGSALMRNALERLPLADDSLLSELTHMLEMFMNEELRQ